MFRCVALPARVPGTLLLHSMPGRYELLESAWLQIQEEQVSVIVCLAEWEEVEEKSSDYAHALEHRTAPCAVQVFAIPDRGAPLNREEFWTLTRDISRRLSVGETVLVHCAGGVGRTAMFATCVLIALGEPASLARSTVSRAGSTVETSSQAEIIRWCAAMTSAAGKSRCVDDSSN